jgi:hypothetical protein
VIVRAEKVERRVEQPRLLQTDEHGVGAVERSQPAIAQPVARPPRFFERLGDARLELESATTLENSQDVPRLRHFKPRERVEEREHAFFGNLVVGRWWHCLQSLR